jgi:hypothetical protein
MAKAPIKLAKVLKFACAYFVGIAFLGTAGFVLWILWLLLAPVFGSVPVTGGSVWVGVGQGLAGLALPVTAVPGNNETLISAGIYNATGELTFSTSDPRIQILGLLDHVILSLLILGLSYLAWQFLVDVIDGTPFTFDNAWRLKWIGWLLLGFGVATPVLHNINARWVLSMVPVQSPPLSPPVIVDIPLILSACFILILSAAFRHGVELETERSLTV